MECRVSGHADLMYKDGVVSNSNKSQYEIALARLRSAKEAETDKERLNTLEQELAEIKDLLRQVLKSKSAI